MTRQPVPSLLGKTAPLFRSFQDEIAQMLDLARGGSDAAGENPGWPNRFATLPAIDVAETDEAVEVSVEVPGVSEEDLGITVQGDALIIKGEKSSDTEDKQKDYQIVERRYGSFRRQIPLGFVPEEGAVSATFDKGVLALVVRKPSTVQSGIRKVQISKS